VKNPPLHKSLYRNKSHHQVTHKRWSDKAGFTGEWRPNQCGTCAYYLPLSGTWGYDWGVCSNPASAFDGTATFEHFGCPHHADTGEWVTQDPPHGFVWAPEEATGRAATPPPKRRRWLRQPRNQLLGSVLVYGGVAIALYTVIAGVIIARELGPLVVGALALGLVPLGLRLRRRGSA
jgi:hypothetical protein